MENLTPDTQPIPDQAAEATPSPTQTIPAAQLAANRSNFKRSTGPRIPQGKLRSASNSMMHGLYSLTNFDGFILNQDIADIALSVDTNYSNSPCPFHGSIHAGTRSSPRPHTAHHPNNPLRFSVPATSPNAYNPNMAPTTNNLPPKTRRRKSEERTQLQIAPHARLNDQTTPGKLLVLYQ